MFSTSRNSECHLNILLCTLQFVDAPEMCSGEHNLEYYSLFQDYLQVYEVYERGEINYETLAVSWTFCNALEGQDILTYFTNIHSRTH